MELWIPAFEWQQPVCLPQLSSLPGQQQFGRGEELTTFLVQIQNVGACLLNDSLGHHLNGRRNPAVIEAMREPNLKEGEPERTTTELYVCCSHPAQLLSASL